MNISLCLTTFNRTELLFESFADVIDDERISEIVIVDDFSDPDCYIKIENKFQDNKKVKIFRNSQNIDCYRNKKEAISAATNEWVIILDSDNILKKQYIDRVEQLWISGLNPKTIYQPSFAEPHFDFRKYESFLIDKSNIGKYMVDATFSTMLNAMNYFVNREKYIEVWDGSIDPVTSDSIYQNLNWFKAGFNMYVVPGLSYTHRVHDGSHYQHNVRRTPKGFHQQVENELK